MKSGDLCSSEGGDSLLMGEGADWTKYACLALCKRVGGTTMKMYRRVCREIGLRECNGMPTVIGHFCGHRGSDERIICKTTKASAKDIPARIARAQGDKIDQGIEAW